MHETLIFSPIPPGACGSLCSAISFPAFQEFFPKCHSHACLAYSCEGNVSIFFQNFIPLEMVDASQLSDCPLGDLIPTDERYNHILLQVSAIYMDVKVDISG